MATLGQILKEAREKKNVTASQAAAATRMKIQTLEALERDDFSRIAAPMYAKGFIKLYAEYLGLDAAPLIREYEERHAPKTRPQLMPEDHPKPRENEPKRVKIKINWSKLKAWMDKWKRPVALGAGLILLFVILVNVITRCSRRITEPPPAAAAPMEKKMSLPVIREPPEPYIETSNRVLETP